MKLADVKVDPNEKYGSLDLEKVFGKKVKRIEGSVSSEFGRDTLVFQLSCIVFEDDSKEFIEGEHDMPYIPGDNRAEIFTALFEEENGPEAES
jgi:hypothetical protein